MFKHKNFANKVAVVTGAGGEGIGHELVLALAKQGANVAFCDIKNLHTTIEKLKHFDVHTYAAHVDIGNKTEINDFLDKVLAEFGHVDLLINNAGIATGSKTFNEITPEDFERITNINYWGVIHTTQAFYPHLLKRKEAAIANLSSSQGILALPYFTTYCTTKFAVRGFTDALRIEHKIRKINNLTIHTVHPGAVATNITKNADYFDENSATFHKQLQKGVSPIEAANTILQGILNNKGRIFISDGKIQDLIARLFPSTYYHLVRLVIMLRGHIVR